MVSDDDYLILVLGVDENLLTTMTTGIGLNPDDPNTQL
jgi:hypothetical protein